MDEVDVERAIMSEGMALAANLDAIRRKVGGPCVTDPDCEDCGDEIPAARRRAMPNTTRCVDCAGKAERGL